MLRYKPSILKAKHALDHGWRSSNILASPFSRARSLSTSTTVLGSSKRPPRRPDNEKAAERKAAAKVFAKTAAAKYFADSGIAGTSEPEQAADHAPVLTEAEYERSMWEATQELGQDEHWETPRSGTKPSTRSKSRTQSGKSDQPSTDSEEPKRTRTSKSEKPGNDADQPKRPRTRKSRAESGKPLDVQKLDPRNIRFNAMPNIHKYWAVPTLKYDLDRVCFNPGVYQIQDQRTRVFNFDPYLTTIMPVDEFDFDALKEYITSSKDTELLTMARKHGKKYCGSTSSTTNILSHFHFLLSAWRRPNMSMLSKSFEVESTNFTRLSRTPAAAFARLNDGVYAIDADKEHDTENVLSSLGKSLEKFLTLPRDDYEKYRRTRSHEISEKERNASEAYHYSSLGDFLLRSQLDARDTRLPGEGIFDLKTRAVVSVRMDVQGYEQGRGYEIQNRFGQWESYEREYYDLIRAAFLKYSLQVRMGRMDGIYLAYHNTQRIFGFQYISLEEMDEVLHGTRNRKLGDAEFRLSMKLLNDLLDKATKRFPGRSLRIHVDTRDTKVPVTYFFAEPVTDEDLASSERGAERTVNQVQKKFLGIQAQVQRANRDAEKSLDSTKEDVTSGDEAETEQTLSEERSAQESTETADDSSKAAWDDIMTTVDEIVNEDSFGVSNVKEALQEALKQADLLYNMSAQSEQILDTLVEKLIVEATGLKPELAESTTHEMTSDSAEVTAEVGDIASQDQGKQIESHDDSGAALTSTDTPQQPTSDQSTEQEQSDSETFVPSPSEQHEAEDTSSGGQIESSLDPRQQTLKELLVELARNVNSRADLGPFERALAKLTDQVELEQTHPKDEIEADNSAAATTENDNNEPTVASSESEPHNPIHEAEEKPLDSKSVEEETQEPVVRADEETTAVEASTVSEKAPKKTRGAAKEEKSSSSREIMGVYLTVRNKQAGAIVDRPEAPLSKKMENLQWSIEYTMTEMSPETAQRLLKQVSRRRAETLRPSKPQGPNFFQERLKALSKQGSEFRGKFDREQEGKETKVVWTTKSLAPEVRTQGLEWQPQATGESQPSMSKLRGPRREPDYAGRTAKRARQRRRRRIMESKVTERVE